MNILKNAVVLSKKLKEEERNKRYIENQRREQEEHRIITKSKTEALKKLNTSKGKSHLVKTIADAIKNGYDQAILVNESPIGYLSEGLALAICEIDSSLRAWYEEGTSDGDGNWSSNCVCIEWK